MLRCLQSFSRDASKGKINSLQAYGATEIQMWDDSEREATIRLLHERSTLCRILYINCPYTRRCRTSVEQYIHVHPRLKSTIYLFETHLKFQPLKIVGPQRRKFTQVRGTAHDLPLVCIQLVRDDHVTHRETWKLPPHVAEQQDDNKI